MKLLTHHNPKTMKGEKYGHETRILHLSPSTNNDKDVNLCSHSSPECVKACLHHAGRSQVFPAIKKARRRKSNMFLNNKTEFMSQLLKEIENADKLTQKKGKILAIRLNGTSDIRWSKVKFHGLNVFEFFPHVQFYDYTKNPAIARDSLHINNYHVTFSWSGTNDMSCKSFLNHGFNVAIPFQNGLPETFLGKKVVDGDISDLRFLVKQRS